LPLGQLARLEQQAERARGDGGGRGWLALAGPAQPPRGPRGGLGHLRGERQQDRYQRGLGAAPVVGRREAGGRVSGQTAGYGPGAGGHSHGLGQVPDLGSGICPQNKPMASPQVARPGKYPLAMGPFLMAQSLSRRVALSQTVNGLTRSGYKAGVSVKKPVRLGWGGQR